MNRPYTAVSREHSIFMTILGLVFAIAISAQPLEASDWGAWGETVRGIDWRVRYDGYNDSARKHKWSYEFRNRFHSQVSIYYTVKDGRGTEDEGGMRLSAGGTGKSWGLFAANSSERSRVIIRGLEHEHRCQVKQS